MSGLRRAGSRRSGNRFAAPGLDPRECGDEDAPRRRRVVRQVPRRAHRRARRRPVGVRRAQAREVPHARRGAAQAGVRNGAAGRATFRRAASGVTVSTEWRHASMLCRQADELFPCQTSGRRFRAVASPGSRRRRRSRRRVAGGLLERGLADAPERPGRAVVAHSPAPCAVTPVSSIRQPAASGSRGTKPASLACGWSTSSSPRVMPRCSVQTASWFSRTASR